MKMFLALIALCSTFALSQTAQAYPTADNVSSHFNLSTGNGRAFNTSRTYLTLNCSFVPGYTTSCPTPPPCHAYLLQGWGTSGNVCCTDRQKCTPDGKPSAELEQKIIQEQSAIDSGELQPVFDLSQQRDSYWGYVTTTSRSPSAGRGNSPQAHLDACMGYAQVDSYPNMGSLADNSQCRTDCDSGTKNGYCNQTQSENGNANQTNAACKDRCDCWMNAAYGKSYNCEGL